jgi:zinc and cadmium transporter
MSVLLWIVTASAIGGLLSAIIAALFAWNARASQVPVLISFAVGALLAAVFLEILPHAFGAAGDPRPIAATILFGILFFFVLEKLVLWRHCHETRCDAHDAQPPQHDHGRSGMMIIIGDTVHNFVDGVLIAAAFVADVQVGIITAIAIIAHEIPQEVGDFLVLLHSGYSRARALALNALSSLAMLGGGLLGYYSLHEMQQLIPLLLAFAAASMIYVAVADLIPGLHRRPEFAAGAQQVLLIGSGVATVWGVGEFLH